MRLDSKIELLRRMAASVAVLCLCVAPGEGQQAAEPVRIQVHADQPAGSLPIIWNFFGYDEPNYTYAPSGKKLLGELSRLSPSPVYVRVHNLLTTGDGSPSLKWGSTGVYTEDAAGNPVYNWTILDRIFDTFLALKIKPLVEVGFMPEALSSHPEPYRHTFPQGSIFTGWAYPPKDYGKWSELVFQFARHLLERYGDPEIKTWLWEIWNEPDIEYWKGTPEEFFKLYDFAAAGILKAVPDARIGGPDSTGPGSPKSVEFLKAFLGHCAREKNYASGKTGSPLSFISFHPKGSPTWQSDHVRMGIDRQLAAMDQGFKIVKSFPEWARTPIVLGESDPEGCAACSAEEHRQNSYRNGPLYASYTAETFSNLLAMIDREQVNFLGSVSWSFEFEGQPYFAGYRELASNGLDKPVLNAFRMLGLLGTARVRSNSSGAQAAGSVLRSGVRGEADINAIATRKEREIEVLLWNYHDEDVATAAAPIDLVVDGLPGGAARVLKEEFRIDGTHSNSFAAWKQMGSPQTPTETQYEALERAGQLQLLDSPAWLPIERGAVHLDIRLPRQGLSLVRMSW